ncbi:hypothetical protein [Mucilaginibacter sp.]|uniref:hypothetical protein n=1 Tax=Mucilaginibacter sp. TaxID=1882438 RepID=UPI002840A475|nr:hypothetical protein [Mucilaginibacter sp.]MDR3696853.1 hypothetical protein [Mucilaginibacter sp.]
MIKKIAIPFLVILICFGCKKKETPTPVVVVTPPDTSTGKPNNEHINVLTQHNDNSRAGFNSHETVLTTANVNSKQFGRLFILPVDDQIYAQPLVCSGLPIASGTHNVVFIATVNNTVYAYDGTKGNLYWKKNFTVSGMRVPNSNDMSSSWCTPYTDFASNIGIVGTPVIDSVSKTIYFVARSTDGQKFVQHLHALDITTGGERAGSPVLITASVAGTGDGNVNGTVNFDPLRNNQRQGLALVNGAVYISWSSHCDWNPYHGWIIGYNAATLQQQIVYNDTPNGENGGIWESGMGIAADAQGSLYITTGNGTTGKGSFSSTGNGTNDIGGEAPTDLTNRAESAVKLTPSGGTLQVSSYFTPINYLNLNANDLDYGVMGTFLVPGTNLYMTGCKDGNLYLLNKDNMGGYSPSINAIQQTIPLNGSMHCQPAFYKGGINQYMYVWSENDQLRAFAFNGGTGLFAKNAIVSQDPGPSGDCGADLSVSSNGPVDGTGILWASYGFNGNAGNSVVPGVLRAFDANDITKELWNSNQTPGDGLTSYAKFCSPTIANGRVYMPTFSNIVVVYGLK